MSDKKVNRDRAAGKKRPAKRKVGALNIGRLQKYVAEEVKKGKSGNGLRDLDKMNRRCADLFAEANGIKRRVGKIKPKSKKSH